jgi:DNA-binding CsgD family transcriptional regulator
MRLTMNRGAIQSLTETQKLCLRHVHDHLTSKDIGRVLGCSPNTVDSHVRTAQKLLGAANRFEAAKILVTSETGPKRGLSSQSSRLAKPLPVSATSVPADMREQQSAKPILRTKLLPLPDFWGDDHDLSNGAKLGWMVLCAIYICLSIGALLALFQAVDAFFG